MLKQQRPEHDASGLGINAKPIAHCNILVNKIDKVKVKNMVSMYDQVLNSSAIVFYQKIAQ